MDQIQKLKESYVAAVVKFYQKNHDIQKKHQGNHIYFNAEETCMPFDMASDSTIAKKGSKEVSVIANQQSKLTCTAVLGATSEGDFLTPMFVFKYSYKNKNGHTPEYPIKYKKWQNATRSFMAKFNQSGFTNEDLIVEWVKNVVIPYKTDFQKVLVLG